MDASISHNGIVDHIEGASIFVRIIQQSACSGCHAKSMCSAAESKEKVIEVANCQECFSIGEEVIISGHTSLGLQAVVLAFVIPLAIAITGISCSLTLFHLNETTAGIIGLSLLLPYYCLLYVLRDKLKRHFIFTLKKFHPHIL